MDERDYSGMKNTECGYETHYDEDAHAEVLCGAPAEFALHIPAGDGTPYEFYCAKHRPEVFAFKRQVAS